MMKQLVAGEQPVWVPSPERVWSALLTAFVTNKEFGRDYVAVATPLHFLLERPNLSHL
jgi:hypothetical protein